MAFTPRLTAPSYSNKFYISTGNGGYNPCIRISGNSCLPNCVGYANGRSRELSGNKAQMPACNAKDWWTRAGYSKGSQPKLGAVMVWGGTKYGHVAIVEKIEGNTLTASMSCYGGARFYLRTFKKGSYNYNGLSFLGFIYNPYVSTDSPASKPASKPAVTIIPAKTDAVFRLYNTKNGDHLFTTSNKEANDLAKSGWKYEGIGWYQDPHGSPVYRLYNRKTGEHFYTASSNEKDSLVKAGWKYEGVAFGSGTGSQVHRFMNKKTGFHFFTISESEKNNCIKDGWKYEGFNFRAKGQTKTTPAKKPSQPTPSKTDSRKHTVAYSYSQAYKRTYTTTANLHMRSGWTTGDAILVTIPKGGKVSCYGYFTDAWLYCQATVNGKNYTGFVNKEYLK